MTMNKKGGGEGFEVTNFSFYVLISIPFILLFFFMILYFINFSTNDLTYTEPNLERNIVLSKFFYSEGCFTYYDVETMRTYPFVIDWNNFNEQRLESCAYSNEKLKITIERSDGIKKTIKNKNWDDDYLVSWKRNILVYDKSLIPAEMIIRMPYD